MRTNRHWTSESLSDFLSSLSMDFADQILQQLDDRGLSQGELAKRTELTDARISQILHGSGNLTLKTMIRLARAVGMKVSVVAYDDGDPDNHKGPVLAHLFRSCWERCGRPESFWDLQEYESLRKNEKFNTGNADD